MNTSITASMSKQHGSSEACRYPPPKPVTREDIAKSYTRSRRGDDASNPLRFHNYQKHRQRVESVKPMVDCKNPLVAKNTFTNPSNFNRSIAQFVQVERENARLIERIATIMRSPKPVINRKQQLKDYQVAEKFMEQSSFFPLFWKIAPASLFECSREKAMANAEANPRPKVFFQLETDTDVLGQIVIELRADVVPLTAENFRSLCTGETGLSYKCSQIHRIVKDYLVQGGDVIGKDGRGSKSIYGDFFPDENFKLKHDEEGVVSMFNYGEKNTNGSQFMITAKPICALDGVNVVVGKVISGIAVVKKLNELVTTSGTMKTKIWITNCGSAGDEGEGEGEDDEDIERYDADDERNESAKLELEASATTEE